MTVIAKNIAYLRKGRKLSQQAMAEQLQLTRSKIASYESGKAEPKAIKLYEIARFFDVSLSQLITENLATLPPERIRTSNTNFRERMDGLLEQRTRAVEVFELKAERLRKVIAGLRAALELKKDQLASFESSEGLVRHLEYSLDMMDELVASNQEIVSYLRSILND